MTDHAHSTGHHHILPLKVYFGVAGALMVLTVITVWISYFHFGALNLFVAMLIAAVKATFVIMYFMHLRYDNKLYTLVFVSAIAFLATFVILTMADTMERGEIYEYKQGPIDPSAAIYDSLNVAPTADIETLVDSTTVDSTAVAAPTQ